MAVTSMFTGVVPFIKRKSQLEVPRPDNIVFRLHYRITFAALCVCCILISSYKFIDKSEAAIQCMLNKGSEVPNDVINRYCWIQSAFTLPDYYEGKKGEDFIHYGVGPYVEGETEQVYHAYYQWVPLMLFFQALCFYTPHWIWKQLEDAFLGGEFMQYGAKVVQFAGMDPEDRVDPMSRVFPHMTKCTFYKYGGSGTIMNLDALCVLGMNILNEKIYVTLWFWFVILSIITGIQIVMRVVQFFMPNTRNSFMELESRGYPGRDIDRHEVRDIVNQLTYPDWLILYYLAQSMDKKNFGVLISKMTRQSRPEPYTQETDHGDATLKSGAKLTNIEKIPLEEQCLVQT